jgi:carbonic anhydrase
MLKALTILAACGITTNALAQDLTPVAPAQTNPVFLVGATVHTASGEVIENGVVSMNEGKIGLVGRADDIMPRIRLSADTQVIDLTGKHIFPGFIGAVTLLGLDEINAVRAMRDFDEVGDASPEVRAYVSVNPDSTLLPVARANGVLTAGVFPTGGLLPGRASVIAMEGWTNEDLALDRDAGVIINWPSMRARRNRFNEEAGGATDRAAERVAALDNWLDQAIGHRALQAADASTPADLRLEALATILPDQPEGSTQNPVFINADDYDQIVAAVNWAAGRKLKPVIVGGRDAALCTDLLKAHDAAVTSTSRAHKARHRNKFPFKPPPHPQVLAPQPSVLSVPSVVHPPIYHRLCALEARHAQNSHCNQPRVGYRRAMTRTQPPPGFTLPRVLSSTLVDRDAPDLELESSTNSSPSSPTSPTPSSTSAMSAGLNFDELATLLESERVDKAYRAMVRILAIRQKFIDAQSHFVTTAQLLSIASAQPMDAKEADQSRKAANKLEALTRSSPVAERGGGGGGRRSLTEGEVSQAPPPRLRPEVSASSPTEGVRPPLPPPAGEGRGEGSSPPGLPPNPPPPPPLHPLFRTRLLSGDGLSRPRQRPSRSPAHGQRPGLSQAPPNTRTPRRKESSRPAPQGQNPSVTILACSDSRLPVERIFDQGIGDLFVVRVAGNVADGDEIGSIEYGMGHLHTPLLVVLGHTKCGAVTAVASGAAVHGSIPGLVDNIIPAVDAARRKNPTLSGPDLIARAIEENVLISMRDVLAAQPRSPRAGCLGPR